MEEQQIPVQQDSRTVTPAYKKPETFGKNSVACSACRWALLVAFLVGILYSKMTVGSISGGGSPFFTGYYRNVWGCRLYLWPVAGVFTTLFAITVLLFCRFYRPGKNLPSEQRQYPLRQLRNGKESLLWLAVLLAAAANLTFGLQGAMDELLVLAIWHGAAVLWVACRTGQLTDYGVGAYLVPDMLRCVGKGFTGLFCWPVNCIQLAAERPRKKAGNQQIFTFFWLMGTAVLLVIALALLSAADDSFAKALAWLKFWQNSSFNIAQLVTNILFGTIFGAFFYGMTVCGRVDVESVPRLALSQRYRRAEKLRRVPGGPVIGMMVLFSGVYALFAGLQLRYLFGALAGQLPRGFTVAGYARQGFFQLCWVMLCNLSLLFLAWLFAKDLSQTRGLRTAAAVLLALSMVLWLTAALKLGLYIRLYGFTPKRLQAVWALLVLATAAGVTTRSLFKPCQVVRPVLLIAGALLIPLLLW